LLNDNIKHTSGLQPKLAVTYMVVYGYSLIC